MWKNEILQKSQNTVKKVHVCFNVTISIHYDTPGMEVVLSTMFFKKA